MKSCCNMSIITKMYFFICMSFSVYISKSLAWRVLLLDMEYLSINFTIPIYAFGTHCIILYHITYISQFFNFWFCKRYSGGWMMLRHSSSLTVCLVKADFTISFSPHMEIGYLTCHRLLKVVRFHQWILTTRKEWFNWRKQRA